MRIACVAAVTLALLAAADASAAQTSTPLPSVRVVHDRFIAALGGAPAILRPRSMTIRGYYDIHGRNGKTTRVQFVTYAADYRQLEIDTIRGREAGRSGYEDGVGWSLAPGAQPQIAKGAALLSARRDADIYYWAHISEYFSSMNVVGIELFAGHRCYHLSGITVWGNKNEHYFDARTGLLVGYAFHQWNASGTGREPAVTRQVLDDYRNFAGLLIPMRFTTYEGSRRINQLQNLSIQFDNVDDRVFTLPASVKAAPKSLRSV